MGLGHHNVPPPRPTSSTAAPAPHLPPPPQRPPRPTCHLLHRGSERRRRCGPEAQRRCEDVARLGSSSRSGGASPRWGVGPTKDQRCGGGEMWRWRRRTRGATEGLPFSEQKEIGSTERRRARGGGEGDGVARSREGEEDGRRREKRKEKNIFGREIWGMFLGDGDGQRGTHAHLLP